MTSALVSAGEHETRVPPELRGEVAAIRDRLAPDESCLVSGSLVEGLGNPHSDVDVYVLRPDGARESVAIGMRTSRYVDCEYVGLTPLQALGARVASAEADDLADLARADLDRYYRISIAERVVVTDAAEQVLDLFRREVACARLETWALIRARGLLARAATTLGAGDRRAAAYLAREAVLWRATSVLAGLGEGYVSVKWTVEKAARRLGRGTAAYEDLLRDHLRPPADPAAVIERLRAQLEPSEDLGDDPAERGQRLADGVSVVPGPGHVHVLCGRRVTRATGPLGDVLAALAASEPWQAATADVALRWRIPVDELRAALWYEAGRLRSEGVLERERGAGR